MPDLLLNRIHCDLNDGAADFISGTKTAADWYVTRQNLTVGQSQGWHNAFTDFFEERLKLRYLEPIQVLRANGNSRGEGFSILAIQCSLIEFLESAVQGVNYKYLPLKQKAGKFEYSASKAIFISFLTKRAPFSTVFTNDTAEDFYASVRCGLLHEARTKNGWRIWAENTFGTVVDINQKVVYRDNFQDAILTHLNSYATQLPHVSDLQEAFIRKLDYLCQ